MNKDDIPNRDIIESTPSTFSASSSPHENTAQEYWVLYYIPLKSLSNKVLGREEKHFSNLIQ